MNHNKIVEYLVKLSNKSLQDGNEDVPICCIITSENNEIISYSFNEVEKSQNSLQHAEIVAINQAMKILNAKYLENCNLYVSVEPCPMCAFAISLARIKNLYIGAKNIKTGAIFSKLNIFESNLACYKPNVFFVNIEDEISQIMKAFFQELR